MRREAVGGVQYRGMHGCRRVGDHGGRYYVNDGAGVGAGAGGVLDVDVVVAHFARAYALAVVWPSFAAVVPEHTPVVASVAPQPHAVLPVEPYWWPE